MLEIHGCCGGFEVGEPPGPSHAELLCTGFFLPAGELFNIMDCLLPEFRGEIVNHPVPRFLKVVMQISFCVL